MSSDETNPPRQHAYSGPPLPQVPEPSHAERVRTLLSLAREKGFSVASVGKLGPTAIQQIDSQGMPPEEAGW